MTGIDVEAIPSRRFVLVPLRADHAAEMTQVLSDSRLYTFTGGTPPADAELRARYQRGMAGYPDPAEAWCNWVIELRPQPPVLAGTVQATIRSSESATEIAWIVGTPWQGQGLATEAAQALVDWLGRNSIRTVTAH